MDKPPRSSAVGELRYSLLVAALGVLAGLAAIALTSVLHATELLVYGVAEEHGLVLTDGVPRWRSSLAVAAVAIVLALAWWGLRARSRDLIGVAGMVAGRRAPVIGTTLNTMLQMVGVGAGLPIGREVAPRELAGMITSRLALVIGLDDRARRILTAAAAGAALGAVYQVPLGGAIFAVELLLAEISTRIMATCLAMSAIAVVVSRLSISPEPQYAAPMLVSTDPHVLVWAVVVGLLLGPVGGWFGDLSSLVKKHSQRGRRTLITLPVAGLLVAVIAWFLPLVLGNGRSAAQAAFLGVGLGVAGATLVGKTLATLLTLRAGAVGGTLAPAIAIGALGGTVIGQLAASAVPDLTMPVPVFAVLGAAAVLATSLRGPATGMLMIAGVTGQGHNAYAALAVAVGAAFATSALRRRISDRAGSAVVSGSS